MKDRNCIFCKIIEGDIPSYKIYESDLLFAFMDINPLSEGHCLIIPKEHKKTLHMTSNEALSEILPLASKIVNALGIEDYNLLQNNGKVAHQAVMHAHFHIIPKPDSEQGLGIEWNPLDGVDQERIAERIKSQI